MERAEPGAKHADQRAMCFGVQKRVRAGRDQCRYRALDCADGECQAVVFIGRQRATDLTGDQHCQFADHVARGILHDLDAIDLGHRVAQGPTESNLAVLFRKEGCDNRVARHLSRLPAN